MRKKVGITVMPTKASKMTCLIFKVLGPVAPKNYKRYNFLNFL